MAIIFFSRYLSNRQKLQGKFGKTFFLEIALKNFWGPFFWRALAICVLSPWLQAKASSIPVLGIERVCPREVGPWRLPRIFLCPWPWPRRLCPRLHSSKMNNFLSHVASFFDALNGQ